MLENSNIFNIKRKLVETTIFSILEKYINTFYFSASYNPIKKNIRNLKKLISSKISKYEKNKELNEKIIEKAKLDYENLEKKEDSENINEKINDKVFLCINFNYPNSSKLNVLFEFLKFFKGYLNKYVHSGSEESDYYLLPRSLFNSDLKYADYMLSLDDFIDKNNDENITANFDKNNNDFQNFKIYSDNKILDINEVIDILFSGNITLFKDKVIPLLESKKEKYKKELNLFDKYFNFFIMDYKTKINEEISQNEFSEKEYTEKDLELFNKFNSFDKIIGEIITDKMNRNDAKVKIDEIKEIIFSTVNNANRIMYNWTYSIIDIKSIHENACLEVYKLIFILKFLEKQRQNFKAAHDRIFEDYKTTLDEIEKKTQEINELMKNNYTFKTKYLIEKWKESKPPFQLKYCEINNLKKIMKELVSTVKLDLNYSFDENFVYWSLKNGYGDYFK